MIEHSLVLESSNSISLGSLPEAVLLAAGISLIDDMDKIQSQTESLKNSANSLGSDLSDEDDDLSIDSALDEDGDDDLSDELLSSCLALQAR